MRTNHIPAVAVAALALAGCALPKQKILSTPAVSMTDSSYEAGTHFNPAGEVTARYCRGDAASSNPEDLNIGLMDEVVHKAQKESGARYIANANFYAQGSCVLLEGTAMK